MASKSETVADIVKRVRRDCNSYPLPTAAAEMLKLVREVEAAHQREVAELMDSAKKQVAELTAIINAECRKCGECAKFGKDCTAGDVDGAEDNRACEKFVSKEVAELEAKLSHTETARKFFARRVNSAKKEVEKLRDCLKEAVFVMQTLFDKNMPKWRKALGEEGGAK